MLAAKKFYVQLSLLPFAGKAILLGYRPAAVLWHVTCGWKHVESPAFPSFRGREFACKMQFEEAEERSENARMRRENVMTLKSMN